MQRHVRLHRKVVIGTRGSRLSLAQARIVADRIKKSSPGLAVEIVVIKTYGDVKKDMKLDRLEQQGVFVKDIDLQLLDGTIDIAVHSLKDIPTKLQDGIRIGAIVERADPRDVVISRDGCGLRDLAKGAKIGTSSMRRKGQLLHFRKDLNVMEMRGNVDTRIAKLDGGEYDAIVLAAAGVERLGLSDRISEYLPFEVMLPAPGQGAIAVEIRDGDAMIEPIVRKIDDAKARAEVEAERTVLSRIGGGCNALLGAYAKTHGSRLEISAAITSSNGEMKYSYSQEGSVKFPDEVGIEVAEKILMGNAAEILPDKSDKSRLAGKVVMVTKDEKEGEGLCKSLLDRRAIPVYFPTIKPVNISYSMKTAHRINKYDFVLVTSRRGADKLLEILQVVGLEKDAFGPVVIAIGPETRQYLWGRGIAARSLPSAKYSKDIIEGLAGVKDRRVLIINSALAGNELAAGLSARGAIVDRITPYAMYVPKVSMQRKNMVMGYKLDFITFASPSAVTGFLKILGRKNAMRLLRRSKVVCIGETTSGKCEKENIKVCGIAGEHTVEGIVKCMERIAGSPYGK